MKHLQKFNESLEDNIYSEIQQMVDANQFLKGKVTATKESVFEAGDFILLLDDLTHITESHIDETIPGSKFEKGVDLKKAIVSLVSNNKPTDMTKGFGPNETKVTNPDEAEKFKWLGLDSKIPVGIENLHKSDPNSEEFKSMNLYKYKDSRGNEFSIKVKEGEGEKTTFLSFIGAKLGKVGDKTVLSVITAFPGQNGASVANRNDFQKLGYYFTTTSKEVIEKSAGQVVESFKTMKYLKKFESFTNEALNIDADYELPDLEEKKKQLNDLFPYDCIDSSHYKMFGYESEEDFENAVKWGEIYPERILSSIKDKLEELFPGFEVDGGVYHGDEKCYITIRKGEDYLKFDLEIDLEPSLSIPKIHGLK
jgi:hypothetical protein